MTLGVVVARFQTPRLTDGHKALLATALAAHRQVLVVLGCTGGQPTDTDPLDYETRAQMVQGFANVRVAPLFDHPSNEQWSRNLDALIGDTDAELFAGRDSFAAVYTGRHPVFTVPSVACPSGTDERALAAACVPESEGERRAVVYATTHRFPTSYQAVDVIIFGHVGAILLGRRADEEQWRFPGGFVEPTDASLEHAAARECLEETGLQIALPEYLGSVRVEDARYRKGRDKVMSAVFTVDMHSGEPIAGDDLTEVRWFDWPELGGALAPEHLKIWQQFKERF